jgi:hypothetical protein
VVESTGLENRRRRMSPVGSNPTPSATTHLKAVWPVRKTSHSKASRTQVRPSTFEEIRRTSNLGVG